MAGIIYLRHGQSISERATYQSNKVTIFAPNWVKDALLLLGKKLKDTVFHVYDSVSKNELYQKETVAESITITDDFNNASLKTLQKIARNEKSNTTGEINEKQYNGIDFDIVCSLRDLVRQCVIVGLDKSNGCGGYRCPKESQEPHRVYVVDLAALQFQQQYNTGRFVLLEKYPSYKGVLDEFIYQNVVGENKRSFEEVKSMLTRSLEITDPDEYAIIKNRYIPHDGFGRSGRQGCYIDAVAYERFVEKDVILSGMAIASMAAKHYPNDRVVFKFLKYGTGYYAGVFASELETRILSAVLTGVDNLLQIQGVSKIIACIELPFYNPDTVSSALLEALKTKYNIDIYFTCEDALKQTQKDYILATTNCGDNHVVFGNEMGYCSVDAAIAENLESLGNIFSPNINLAMEEKFLDLKIPLLADANLNDEKSEYSEAEAKLSPKKEEALPVVEGIEMVDTKPEL